MKKLSFLFAALAVASIVHATQYYWTGAEDTDFTNPKNWVTGSKTSTTVPSACPADSDYVDPVYFTDRAPADKRMVNLPGDRWMGQVNVISSTGWKFTGSAMKSKKFNVEGSDLGLVADFAQIRVKGQGFNIPQGSEICISYAANFQDGEMVVTGSGTLRFKCKINQNLYSSEKGCKISDGALVWSEVAESQFSTSASYYFWMTFCGRDARYRFKGTPAAAEALFETKTKNAMNFVNKYDTENYQLAVRALDGDLSGYVEIYLTPKGAPKIERAALTNDEEGKVAVNFLNGESVVDYSVIAEDGVSDPMEIPLAEGVEARAEQTLAIDMSSLAADTTYSLTLKAFKGDLSVTQKLGCAYNGTPVLTKIVDANELGLVPGCFTVEREDASEFPLVVNLAYSSTDGAVGGRTYVVPATTVTIPANEKTVAVELVPLSDPEVATDTTVTIALADGHYVGSPDAKVDLVIKNIVIPANTAVWAAGEGSDGNASNPENWYGGVLPKEGEDILLNSAFSASNLTWDASSENGLPKKVGNWLQQGWTGTVTIPTTYEGDFTELEITGDLTLDRGKWTTPKNGTAETYILNVKVGGVFRLGEAAVISVQGKGFDPGKFREGSAIGAHAATYSGNFSHIYGDVYAPTRIGSGGHGDAFSCGGGAIKLTVAGSAVIDGTLDAQSSTQSSTTKPNPEKGVGAGGSIFVTASSISGTGTVIASAYENNGTSYSDEAGSGGRIALVSTVGEVSIPNENLKCSGSFGGNGVGGGTIFLKNAADANGTLLIEDRKAYSTYNYSTHWPTKGRFAAVKPGETWMFDRVLFSGQGVLSVPEGATLVLPNGFASIAGLADNAAPTVGLLYLGGTISVPAAATHELSGSWLFQAATPYAFPTGDVIVSDKAAIGCFELHSAGANPTTQPNCDVTVNGNLTIAKGSSLLATGRGHRSTDSSPYGGAHGGIGNTMADSKAFDSILHPKYAGGSAGAGNGGVYNNVSGGAIKLTVAGAFEMNGSANVKSSAPRWDSNKAAAGSLDVTAGSLSGSGSFCADGLASEANSVLSGAGGRIAIHLTDEGATFDDFDVSKITADSAMSTGKPELAGSAGTVYLEVGEAGTGTIIIKSTNSAVKTPTPIPSQTWGGETDNLKAASLSVQSYGIVRMTASLKMAALTVETNSKLDLNGKTLTVNMAKLGGTKFKPGIYAAGEAALGDYVIDSVGGGSLVVKGTGMMLLIR